MNPGTIQWATYWLLEIKSSHIINVHLNLMNTGSMKLIGAKNSVGSKFHTKFIVSPIPPTFSGCGVQAILRRHVLGVVCAGMARNGNNIGKFPSDSAATTARSARGWSGVNCSHQSGHQCHQPGWGASRGAQRLSKYLWTFQLKQQQQLGSVVEGAGQTRGDCINRLGGFLDFPGDSEAACEGWEHRTPASTPLSLVYCHCHY